MRTHTHTNTIQSYYSISLTDHTHLPYRHMTKLLSFSPSVSAADLTESGMQTLEHVAVTVTITHPCRGNMEIVLICPSGMASVIGARRAVDRCGHTHTCLHTYAPVSL